MITSRQPPPDFSDLLSGHGPHGQAFALIHRSQSPGGTGLVDAMSGEMTSQHSLADLAVGRQDVPAGQRHEVLAVIPYRQITERGFDCRDDQEPILAMNVRRQARLPVADVIAQIADVPVVLSDGDFDIDDEAYAELVRGVLTEEIGTGAGSNFVIKRCFTAAIPGYSVRVALAVFRRLLLSETGAYWTFLVHTGARTFIGASPERHVSLGNGLAVMNPISGTCRYGQDGPRLEDILRFLADPKETEELCMVVDEELKMMARVCASGGRVVGPFLKEMARLAHTEYLIEGHSSLDVRDVLRETLPAPTVTGSPVQNACRVIARREPAGRGYYSGVLALLGTDAAGAPAIDSSILIRTADIDQAGHLRIGVGATLVRLSDPDSEVAETRVKAAGLLAALGVSSARSRMRGTAARARIADRPEVGAALTQRNAVLAPFWFDPPGLRGQADPRLAGLRALIVDAEDTFTAMLGQHLRALGLSVAVESYRRFAGAGVPVPDVDLAVVGPGPGDPTDLRDARIAALYDITRRLMTAGVPFLSICLGHQVLSGVLGLPLSRIEPPNQGTQQAIDFFGRAETVGFYNTFAARSDTDSLPAAGAQGPVGATRGIVEVSRDPVTGRVHGLRGAGFISMQFHPESLLTRGGSALLAEHLAALATRATALPVTIR
ncbi:MAG TPA: anthranilate synthase family protein [Streptosporangiaceae bacterium]